MRGVATGNFTLLSFSSGNCDESSNLAQFRVLGKFEIGRWARFNS